MERFNPHNTPNDPHDSTNCEAAGETGDGVLNEVSP
jgi:hypothetical protein